MYKAIAVDLDKTTLRTDCSLSPYTIGVFDAAKRAGVEIVICTGRSVREIWQHAADLPCGRYMVALNGAQIFDNQLQRPIAHQSIDRRIATEMVSYLQQKRHLYYQMYSGDVLYTTPQNRDVLEQCGMAPEDYDMTKDALCVEPKLMEKLEAEALAADKFLTMTPFAMVADRIKADFETMPGLNFTRSDGNNLEVMPKGVNKGTGLCRVMKLLGLEKQQMIAFGDSENDLPMFSQVGLCVAVGNASETVKKAAHRIAGDNEADGVARVIEEFFLLPH